MDIFNIKNLDGQNVFYGQINSLFLADIFENCFGCISNLMNETRHLYSAEKVISGICHFVNRYARPDMKYIKDLMKKGTEILHISRTQTK